jgi:hypothetical protein
MTDTSTDEIAERLAELLAKVSAGDWYVNEIDVGYISSAEPRADIALLDGWPIDCEHEQEANKRFICFAKNSVPALLTERAEMKAELATLREAIRPVKTDQDQQLASAVRDAMKRLCGDEIDMELELAAQHIENGRIVNCSDFAFQIENDEMKARIAAMELALRAIGSCESFHKDDVVSIARQALNEKPDAFAKWADGLIDSGCEHQSRPGPCSVCGDMS